MPRSTHPNTGRRLRRAIGLTVAIHLGLALGLAGCDQQRIDKLEEGVATEVDVRRQFGEPKQVTERADGSKLLEYTRQPEGTTNYAIEIGPDGKMSALRQLLTPANFAKVVPGMPQAEVRRLLGMPGRVHAFALRPDEAVWEWRFIDASKGPQTMVFVVTFDRAGRVLGSQISEDPRNQVSSP